MGRADLPASMTEPVSFAGDVDDEDELTPVLAQKELPGLILCGMSSLVPVAMKNSPEPLDCGCPECWHQDHTVHLSLACPEHGELVEQVFANSDEESDRAEEADDDE